MPEKLCLQWNDFINNVKCAFGSLREDNDFADVTLACEDGKYVKAHKVILAASSPFFKTLLGSIKHPQPLIYMRGVKSEDLVAIIDFLYLGEANVLQDNLDSFLAIAQELQLKGLMEKQTKGLKILKKKQILQKNLPALNTNANISQTSFNRRQESMSKIQSPEDNTTGAIPSNFSEDFEVKVERMRSLIGECREKLNEDELSEYDEDDANIPYDDDSDEEVTEEENLVRKPEKDYEPLTYEMKPTKMAKELRMKLKMRRLARRPIKLVLLSETNKGTKDADSEHQNEDTQRSSDRISLSIRKRKLGLSQSCLRMSTKRRKTLDMCSFASSPVLTIKHKVKRN